MAAVAVPIPLDKVDAVWPRVLPHLERAIEHSEGWTVDLVNQRIHNSQALLWVVFDGHETVGVAVSELHGETAYIALVGGVRWPQWRHEISKIYEWANLAGCRCVTVDGRAAWCRLLRADGFRSVDGLLTKDL